MKQRIIIASLGMLAISAITFVSCSKDDELDGFNSLDISDRTPTTRSSMSDFEPARQPSPYEVPQNENECMLYAIISIAASKRIPITYVTSDGHGGYQTKTKKIGQDGFTATDAYNYVKGLATGQSWTPCDVYGNPIPDAEPYNYTGGAMAPSVARSIGEKSGILKGTTMYFNTYEELQAYISTPSFKKDHPSGTYIINSDSAGHAVIGKGVDNKGNVKYSDANHGSSKYKDSEKNGGWTLIF